jgi:hydroxyacylglutathione hydrolase
MLMRTIYDERLAQAAYLLGCQATGEAIIIDPERDVDRYIDLAAEHDLRIVAVAETVSGAGDEVWQYGWLDQRLDGGSYDHRLLHDGDRFSIGNIEFTVMHTPGHTPEHIAFLVTDHGTGATAPIGLLSGDFVFVGDLGRPDLLETAAGQVGAREPSARRLFTTTARIDDIPEFVQVWPAHGAGSACGKALGAVPSSTIGYERRFNPALQAATSETAFVDYILSGQPEPPLYFARMKRDNRDGPAVLGGLPEPPRRSAEELQRLDTRAVALIDTRPWDAFRAGHVPGALSFPIEGRFNTHAGSLVAEDEEIHLLGSAADVEEAVRQLVRIGLDRIAGWFDEDALAGMPALATSDEIAPEDAAPLLEDPAVAVLDVRRATEFAAGHLPGAVNIAHTRLASRLDELPDAPRLLVCCRTGDRAARSCAYLQRLGRAVVNLAGGMEAWESAGVAVGDPGSV